MKPVATRTPNRSKRAIENKKPILCERAIPHETSKEMKRAVNNKAPSIEKRREEERAAKNCSNPLHPPDCLAPECLKERGIADPKHRDRQVCPHRDCLSTNITTISDVCRGSWQCGNNHYWHFCSVDGKVVLEEPSSAYGLTHRLGDCTCTDEDDDIYKRCKACDTQIHNGNCCGEACTKAWMAEIEKVHREKSKGKRHCRNCGAAHEMKSNHCGECDGEN